MSLKDLLKSDLDHVFSGGLQTAAIHSINGQDNTVNVFFNIPYNKAGGDRIESASPYILVKTADAGNIEHASTFEINGIIYSVIEIESNNQGTVKIHLSED